jgi:hypothetical protein
VAGFACSVTFRNMCVCVYVYVFNNDEVGTVVEYSVRSTVAKVVIRYDCRKYTYLLTKI